MKISRKKFETLQRIAPSPGEGHLRQCLSLLRGVYQGWGSASRLKNIHLAVAYLQKEPPDLDIAETILEELRQENTGDIHTCLNMAILRIQSHRLQNGMYEVLDEE